jgi:PAS domain S-box-containing protein
MPRNYNIADQIISKNSKLLSITVHEAQEEIFWISKNRRILYANKSACEHTGYSQEELLKLDFTDIDNFVSQRDWFKFWKEIKEQENLRYESFHINKDGEKIPVEVSVNFYQIVDREFITAFCHDIVKRREAEDALKDSEESFRSIAETSVDNIIHLNEEQVIIYSSPASKSIFGYGWKEITNRKFDNLLQPQSINSFQNAFNQAIKGKKITNTEFEIITKQNEKRVVEASLVAFNKGIEEKNVQLIVQNITERKKTEQQLEQALLDYENIFIETELLNQNLEKEINERKKIEEELIEARQQAESANQAKSEFLANMSHEIRTPLNAVLGFAEILKDKLSNQPQFDSYIDGINTGGRSLLSLINDILDLSKIEAGRLEIQREPINPQNLLTEVEQIFSAKISSKGLALITKLQEGMPEAINIDDTRARQILFNLVGNAIKFTAIGSVSINFKFEPSEKENNLIDFLMIVKDTGMGIPRKQQKLIFEPFRQKEGQSTRKFGGTGLGLTITKRLVEMMNGEISVKSRITKGATFSVRLRDVEIADASKLEKNKSLLDLENIIFEESKILLAEDNISNQQVFLGLLERYNFNITVANNGKEALEYIYIDKPDVVIMDIRMPEMDGTEATKIIRQNKKYKTLPIIAMSASLIKNYGNNEFHIFNESLAKPINKRELITTLAKYLPYTINEQTLVDEPETQKEAIIDFTLSLTNDQLTEFKEDVSENITPLIQELKEFVDAEDAQNLVNNLNIVAEKFKITPYITISKDLLESVNTFQVSKTEQILHSLSELNKKLISSG